MLEIFHFSFILLNLRAKCLCEIETRYFEDRSVDTVEEMSICSGGTSTLNSCCCNLRHSETHSHCISHFWRLNTLNMTTLNGMIAFRLLFDKFTIRFGRQIGVIVTGFLLTKQSKQRSSMSHHARLNTSHKVCTHEMKNSRDSESIFIGCC